MTTYFGGCNSDGTLKSGGEGGIDRDSTPYFYWTITNYACPGTGNQNIQEISGRLNLVYGTSHNFRFGIYNAATPDTNGTLVAEGTAVFTISGSSYSWQGHTAQANVKAAGGSSPGVLVGGNSYKIALATNSSNDNWSIGMQSNASTGWREREQNSTGGLPTNIPTYEYEYGYEHALRCGVDEAAGASPINVTPSDNASTDLADIITGRYNYLAKMADTLE